MVRRDTGQKTPVKEADIPATVEKLLAEIQDNLFAKAKAILQEKTTTVQSYEEFKKVVCDKGGFLKAAWCGSADCEAKIKDETGATIRVRPSKERNRRRTAFTVGRKLRKWCILQGRIDRRIAESIALIFYFQGFFVLGTFIFSVSKCLGNR